jgi:hypothetical protein
MRLPIPPYLPQETVGLEPTEPLSCMMKYLMTITAPQVPGIGIEPIMKYPSHLLLL